MVPLGKEYLPIANPEILNAVLTILHGKPGTVRGRLLLYVMLTNETPWLDELRAACAGASTAAFVAVLAGGAWPPHPGSSAGGRGDRLFGASLAERSPPLADAFGRQALAPNVTSTSREPDVCHPTGTRSAGGRFPPRPTGADGGDQEATAGEHSEYFGQQPVAGGGAGRIERVQSRTTGTPGGVASPSRRRNAGPAKRGGRRGPDGELADFPTTTAESVCQRGDQRDKRAGGGAEGRPRRG